MTSICFEKNIFTLQKLLTDMLAVYHLRSANINEYWFEIVVYVVRKDRLQDGQLAGIVSSFSDTIGDWQEKHLNPLVELFDRQNGCCNFIVNIECCNFYFLLRNAIIHEKNTTKISVKESVYVISGVASPAIYSRYVNFKVLSNLLISLETGCLVMKTKIIA